MSFVYLEGHCEPVYRMCHLWLGPAAPFPLHCFSQEARSSGQFWEVPFFRLDLARPVSWALLHRALVS